MTRRAVARSLLLAPLAAGGLLLAGPAAADSGSAVVGDATEAWYQTSAAALCATAVGCTVAAPPSTYPAGELHVGVSGGQETERSYLKLDLGSLPPDAKLTGGVLTLPLSQDQNAGQVQAASATFQACLVTQPFTDAEGATTAPPTTDCKTASRKARLAANQTSFTIDLTPFAAAWASGVPNQGLALVPDSPGPTDAWQVSIDGRKSSGTAKVSATVTYDAPASASGTTTTTTAPSTTTGAPPPAAPAPPMPVQAVGANPLPVPAAAPPAALPAAGAAAPAAAPAPVAAPAAAPLAVQPQAAVGPIGESWLSYRGAVYVPLAGLVVLWLLARALLRPVAPARHLAEGFR